MYMQDTLLRCITISLLPVGDEFGGPCFCPPLFYATPMLLNQIAEPEPELGSAGRWNSRGPMRRPQFERRFAAGRRSATASLCFRAEQLQENRGVQAKEIRVPSEAS